MVDAEDTMPTQDDSHLLAHIRGAIDAWEEGLTPGAQEEVRTAKSREFSLHTHAIRNIRAHSFVAALEKARFYEWWARRTALGGKMLELLHSALADLAALHQTASFRGPEGRDAAKIMADLEAPILEASHAARILFLASATPLEDEDGPAIAWMAEKLQETTGRLVNLFHEKTDRAR